MHDGAQMAVNGKVMHDVLLLVGYLPESRPKLEVLQYLPLA